MLIDGRNRREACRRAGIVPDHVLLDGQDPVAYILSANINRRHMTKGQRAIVVAKICLETKQPIRDAAKQSGLKDNCVAYASTILHHAPDLADQVINGSLSLDKAYEEAKIRKGQVDLYDYRFNLVKRDGPDLAELVIEGQLTLEEAEAALRERMERIHRNKILLAQALHDLARHAYLLDHPRRADRSNIGMSFYATAPFPYLSCCTMPNSFPLGFVPNRWDRGLASMPTPLWLLHWENVHAPTRDDIRGGLDHSHRSLRNH